MLWFALHFPFLPLEAQPLRQSPSVVVARGRVLAADAAARAAGVRDGLRLSTALGLVPGLAVCERAAGREAAALEALACWAGRFTPEVSLAPPATLLLEIGGCLRLFGGAEALIAAALAACGSQGYTAAWAAAPTPLGATWLAWGGAAAIHAEAGGFQRALAALPAGVAAWPAEIQARLAAFGAATLGDLRRLPGAGLRRRLGSGVVDDLLRAWGEIPDPRPVFVFPERFAQTLELPARVDAAAALAFAGQRLFAALAGWLNARQRLVRGCRLGLIHDDGGTTELPLRLAEATADEVRLGRLLREHLGRLRLAAPVEGLTLAADDWVARPGSSGHLFDLPPAGEGVMACLERLQGRLGETAVHTLGLAADYRPECASRAVPPGNPSSAMAVPAGLRPLWLLPRPQPLAERAGRPQWHGPLALETRPERLESGWWDAGEPGAPGDARRDYCVAKNPLGQWLWVFRDGEGWFLHGLFG